MLYREIIAVCSQIHTKHINILRGQNGVFLNVKLVVHVAPPGLQKSKEHYSSINFFPSSRNSPTQRWPNTVCILFIRWTSDIPNHWRIISWHDNRRGCIVSQGVDPCWTAVRCFHPPSHPQAPIVDLQCYQTRMAEPTAEQLCRRTVKLDAFTSFNRQC
jgi:hypothetical protein